MWYDGIRDSSWTASQRSINVALALLLNRRLLGGVVVEVLLYAGRLLSTFVEGT